MTDTISDRQTLSDRHNQWQRVTVSHGQNHHYRGNHSKWQTKSLSVIVVSVTESDCLFDSDSDNDWKWLCLSLRVIAFLMEIFTVTDSDCVRHWEWLPLWWWFSQWLKMIVSVTESDCICDGDFDNDWRRFLLWLTVIVFVTESDCIFDGDLTMTDGDSYCDWQWLCMWLRVSASVTEIFTVSDVCHNHCHSLWCHGEWLHLWWWFWQWMIVIVSVTESDCICDIDSKCDWQWLCLSLRVIASVMEILTVTDSDCVKNLACAHNRGLIRIRLYTVNCVIVTFFCQSVTLSLCHCCLRAESARRDHELCLNNVIFLNNVIKSPLLELNTHAWTVLWMYHAVYYKPNNTEQV